MTPPRQIAPRNWFAVEEGPTEPVGRMVPHDRLDPGRLTGWIRLAIEFLRPLHVGSGAFTIVDGELRKGMTLRAGTPIVPGTSLKGICRQTYEALTSSGSPFDRREQMPARQAVGKAATLFGTLGYQGRVSFDDATPASDVALTTVRLSAPYPPRRAAGRRFYGELPHGADQPPRIPTLALPSGARLTTYLRFRNVDEGELGGVLTSLGIDRFAPRLGGGKYDAYGQVRFSVVECQLRRPWGEPRRDVDVAEIVRTSLAAFEPSESGRAALAKLEQRLAPPAPRGDSP